jgi:hypothetical protein
MSSLFGGGPRESGHFGSLHARCTCCFYLLTLPSSTFVVLRLSQVTCVCSIYLQLLDRIVFPELLKGEEISEKLFYAQRGIEMKPEFAEKEKNKSRPTNHPPESPNNAPSRSSVSTTYCPGTLSLEQFVLAISLAISDTTSRVILKNIRAAMSWNSP